MWRYLTGRSRLWPNNVSGQFQRTQRRGVKKRAEGVSHSHYGGADRPRGCDRGSGQQRVLPGTRRRQPGDSHSRRTRGRFATRSGPATSTATTMRSTSSTGGFGYCSTSRTRGGWNRSLQEHAQHHWVSGLSGQFDIVPTVWGTYGRIILALKSGNGHLDPDWAAFELLPKTSSGTWEITVDDQTLSHAKLYGVKGLATPATPRPCRNRCRLRFSARASRSARVVSVASSKRLAFTIHTGGRPAQTGRPLSLCTDAVRQ